VNEQREAFEAWMREQNYEQQFDRFDEDHEHQPNEYEDWNCQVAYEAWQAAIEHAKKTMCNRN
jgi:hypothetical protein